MTPFILRAILTLSRKAIFVRESPQSMPLLNPFSMRRLPQVVLIVTTAETAWLMMQIVHELGHVPILFGTLFAPAA